MPHCPQCGRSIAAQTVQQIVDRVRTSPAGTGSSFSRPVVRGRKGEYRKLFDDLRRQGFVRVRVDGDAPRAGRARSTSTRTASTRSRWWWTGWSSRTREAPAGRLARDRAPAGRRRGRGRGAGRRPGVGRSPSGSPAPAAGSRSRRSRPGCSPSTTRTGPARTAAGSDAGSSSTPTWSCRTREVARGRGARPVGRGAESVYFKQTLAVLARRRRVQSRDAVEGSCRRPPGSSVLRGGRRRRRVRRRPRRSSRGATRRPTSEETRQEIERFMSERPCPTCRGGRLRVESLAVRVGDRSIHEVSRADDRGGRAVLRRRSRSASASGHRAARAQGDPRAAGVPPERRARLPDARPRRRHALGRRGAADPARHPDRLQPGRRPLHPRRALDRPAPARQPAAPRYARCACATSATRSSSSSTTRRPSARADHVIDLGPGGGSHGGYLVAAGRPPRSSRDPKSLTGRYLSRASCAIPVPAAPPARGSARP